MKTNITQKTAQQVTPPTQMSEAGQTAEQLLKLSIAANELNFAIKGRENEIRDLQSKLLEVRKEYSNLKPRVLGIMAALE